MGRKKVAAGFSVEVLVEEQSAGELLQPNLARWLGGDVKLQVRTFRGKPDLLSKLPSRLSGYAEMRRNGHDVRVVVLVDKDDEDCGRLKARLEAEAREAGLCTRDDAVDGVFTVVNRIAVRELENWYFGDWAAVRRAFPKLPAQPPRTYRANPDHFHVKTSDAFAEVLQRAGVRIASKPEWARRIGPYMQPSINSSRSFQVFLNGVRSLTGGDR